MRRLSASISDVYCSVGSKDSPALCDAARSCPGSGVSAALADTVFSGASGRSGIPASVSVSAHIPTDSRHGRRKRPASGERRVCDGMWPAAVWDGGCDNNLARAADVSPTARTRRMPPSAHSS